ncbi:hypothetical protein VITU9109_13761 [Vibrio tubiashii ATCC 19109]|uniref:Uncharacterized protein n=1 Tax=Vibrio tubiashii ATCC 19109 TaxID=1051646 RepID=A0ABN0DFM3_9VIBR|nr:hypothetical protein VITU9109_13761 [Vibrio tubiashii ATCC 19109]
MTPGIAKVDDGFFHINEGENYGDNPNPVPDKTNPCECRYQSYLMMIFAMGFIDW